MKIIIIDNIFAYFIHSYSHSPEYTVAFDTDFCVRIVGYSALCAGFMVWIAPWLYCTRLIFDASVHL